jgi:hypothetical protein
MTERVHTTIAQDDSLIINELTRIQRSIHRRVWFYGFCAVLTGGCVSLMTIVCLDWLLVLPPSLRVFGVVLFILGFGLAVMRWIVRPLQYKLSVMQVAAMLEQHFGNLNDRLTSTVSFLTDSTGDSPEMMRRVIANTEHVFKRLPLRTILTIKPMVTQAVLLVLVLALLLSVAGADGRWLSTGVQRYVRPFGGTEWPRRVNIEAVTGNMHVAIGESVTLQMRITKGRSSGLRGIVHLESTSGDRSRLTMRQTGDLYVCEVDAIMSDYLYWFEAGDHVTSDSPGTIRAVQRPSPVDVLAHVYPPSYVEQTDPITYDMSAGTTQAVEASRVVIEIHANKPIAADREGRPLAGLRLEGDADSVRTVPLRFASAGSASVLTGELTVDHDTEFRVNLTCRDDLQTLSTQSYQLATVSDRPPTVEIHRPAAKTYTTPDGVLRLTADITDDFGVAGARLMGTIGTGSSDSRADRTIRRALTVANRSQGSRRDARATVEQTLSIADWNITPPATVKLRVEASDNKTIDGQFQTGVSGQVLLQVVGRVEMETRARDALAAIKSRLIRAIESERLLRLHTEKLADFRAASERGAGRRPDARLASRQVRIGREISILGKRLDELVRELKDGRLDDRFPTNVLVQAANHLDDVSAGPVAEAADALKRATSVSVIAESRADRERAIDLQNEIIQSLESVHQHIGQWGQFQTLLMDTRSIADRQQAISRETADVGGRTLGKNSDDLSDAERLQLQRLDELQRSLSQELDALLEQHETRTDQTEGRKNAEDAAINDTINLARRRQVSKQMVKAARAIAQNRISGAKLDQEQVQRTLSRMLATLEQRELRRLAELTGRLEQAHETIRRLLTDQVNTTTTTEAAISLSSPVEALTALAPQQRRLQRNTSGLGREMLDRVETTSTAAIVMQASAVMRDAAVALESGDGSATSHQKTAIEILSEALQELERQTSVTREALFQKTMAAVHAKLQEFAQRQVQINTVSVSIVETYMANRRMNRSIARQASRLSRDEDGLIAAVGETQEMLEDTVVYRRLIERVVQGMAASSKALRQRDLDGGLLRTQEDVLTRLDQMMAALVEIRNMRPEDSFEDGRSGGGGGGSDRSSSPVPPAAELVVLKSMQARILAETAALGNSGDDASSRSEQALAATESIGRKQSELRELTLELIESVAKER